MRSKANNRFFDLIICLALSASGSGCSEELGPVSAAKARVSGRVVYQGRGVEGGWIELIPVDGTVGTLRTAPVGRDGRFEMSGVAVGKNAIRLVHPPMTMFGRTVTIARDEPSLLIDMNEEVREYLKASKRPSYSIRSWPPSVRGSIRTSESL
jgi:hypothetical protein